MGGQKPQPPTAQPTKTKPDSIYTDPPAGTSPQLHPLTTNVLPHHTPTRPHNHAVLGLGVLHYLGFVVRVGHYLPGLMRVRGAWGVCVRCRCPQRHLESPAGTTQNEVRSLSATRLAGEPCSFSVTSTTQVCLTHRYRWPSLLPTGYPQAPRPCGSHTHTQVTFDAKIFDAGVRRSFCGFRVPVIILPSCTFGWSVWVSKCAGVVVCFFEENHLDPNTPPPAAQRAGVQNKRPQTTAPAMWRASSKIASGKDNPCGVYGLLHMERKRYVNCR